MNENKLEQTHKVVIINIGTSIINATSNLYISRSAFYHVLSAHKNIIYITYI